MRLRGLTCVLAVLAAGPAYAGERGFSVTEFDRIDVVGPVQLIVETGRGPSARATGTPSALDRVSVEVRSRRLVIRSIHNAWGGNAEDRNSPVIIRASTHDVFDVRASGTSSVAVNRMTGATLTVGASGAASITVGTLSGDRVSLVQDGSGLVSASGKALSATLSNKGTGRIAAEALDISDLTIMSTSAGPIAAKASRSAKIVSLGQGDVTVTGKPACTVNAPGGGTVTCGTPKP